MHTQTAIALSEPPAATLIQHLQSHDATRAEVKEIPFLKKTNNNGDLREKYINILESSPPC